jgi:hypothetical protein
MKSTLSFPRQMPRVQSSSTKQTEHESQPWNESSKPIDPMKSTLSFPRKMPRVQSSSAKRTEHEPRPDDDSLADLYNSMEDDDDFDIVSLLDTDTVPNVLAQFFSELDIIDELEEFHSSLEEEMEEFHIEIWRGVNQLKRRMGELRLLPPWVGLDQTMEEEEEMGLNENGHQIHGENDMSVSEIHRDVLELDEVQRIINDLHEASTSDKETMSKLARTLREEVRDRVRNVQVASKARASGASQDLNSLLHKVLQKLMRDLHEMSKQSETDTANNGHSQLIDDNGCGLNLLGDEMRAFLLSRTEMGDEELCNTDQQVGMKLLMEATETGEVDVAVSYWMTGPNEELEEF